MNEAPRVNGTVKDFEFSFSETVAKPATTFYQNVKIFKYSRRSEYSKNNNSLFDTNCHFYPSQRFHHEINTENRQLERMMYTCSRNVDDVMRLSQFRR